MTVFRKSQLFVLITVLFTITATLIAAEMMLRGWQRYLRGSEAMDSGLIRYDPHLGWALTPNWSGRHRHHDFDVAYTVNRLGFRKQPGASGPPSAGHWAVVGDSFTFGLGVDDDETFVALLDHRQKDGRRFVNYGVPGYSTDQAYLLIRQQVVFLKPAGILLCVYLGNDLFDNLRPYPLQADHAKPYFVHTDGGLVLKNVPVPRMPKPTAASGEDLAQAVWGTSGRTNGGWWDAAARRWRLLGLLKMHRPFGKPDRSVLREDRYREEIELFALLLQQIQALCRLHRIELAVALLAGRSHAAQPHSDSAAFQEALRRRTRQRCEALRIPVIDLAAEIRNATSPPNRRLYYPHEGHLTAEGHLAAATAIGRAL